jgi:hypothetical protein
MKLLLSFLFAAAAGTVVMADIPALDLSAPRGTSVWTCVQGEGFVKGIPRLYQEACGVNYDAFSQLSVSGI